MIVSLHPLVKLPKSLVYCILYLCAGLTTLRNGRSGNGLCHMYRKSYEVCTRAFPVVAWFRAQVIALTYRMRLLTKFLIWDPNPSA